MGLRTSYAGVGASLKEPCTARRNLRHHDRAPEDTMAQTPPFEIPQQLRELAERNVEQARTAYGQFMDAMVQATGMWSMAMPANAMTSGFKTVQDRAVRFAKQNAEAGFALASELANAKDI